jgi:hypothetical protein
VSKEIPFGHWHPDAAGLNAASVVTASGCRPTVNGFLPMPSMAAASAALEGDCLGAAVIFDENGAISTFAGDASKLYKLSSTSTWDDVSRTTGGIYSSGSGARWQFGFSGGLVIACTIGEPPQKYQLGSSTDFAALGGSPPNASYIATVRDFVVLGGLSGDLNTIHWSGLAQPEWWTPGTNSCDTQTFQNGGPVRGLIGGEVGYVFQAQAISRMTFVPGSDLIFQIDKVEDGRGLAAPYSLVRVGGVAYYLASDGFYKFDLGAAGSTPLGVGKWAKWFLSDLSAGLVANVVGSLDPLGRYVIWAYPTTGASGTQLNRCLIYDWALDEATTADLTITALAQILTQGVTLDTMDSFGNLDTLAFSLDSAVWQGGANLLAVFGSDRKMSFFSGAPMATTWVTNDGRVPHRNLIKGVRPHIDTFAVTAAIAAREAEADPVTFGIEEAMDETGNISTWASGNFVRARFSVPAGAIWTKMLGAEVASGPIGKR